MNFPEVGVWNNAVPYVADTQTEQHRMIVKEKYTAISNPGGWGIGTYATKANWAEEPWWCGIFTNHCLHHGGYRSLPGRAPSWAAANSINETYGGNKPKPITTETSGTLASVPMYIDPKTQTEMVDPEIYETSISRATGRSTYMSPLAAMYNKKHVTIKQEIEVPTIKKKKSKKVKAVIKKTISSEKIPVTIY